MKRIISAVYVVCLFVSTSYAQSDCIAIFSDYSSTSCNIVDTGGLIQYHVVHLYSTGSTSSSFSIPIPSCMNGPVYLGETVNFAQVTGESRTGITIEYGACFSSPISILTVNMFGSGVSDECCHIIPLGHPQSPSGKIEVTDCASNVYLADVGYATVNETELCQCGHPTGIPPEASTPIPPDSATGASLDATLQWDTFDPLNLTSTFTMFFGSDPDPPKLPVIFYESSWDPAALAPNTTYYWKVGIYYAGGALMAVGPVWQFTTMDPSPVETKTWGAIKALYRDD